MTFVDNVGLSGNLALCFKLYRRVVSDLFICTMSLSFSTLYPTFWRMWASVVESSSPVYVEYFLLLSSSIIRETI